MCSANQSHRRRTHVFVSFANVDVDVVRRLANRLQAQGVAVWTGDEKLSPGTLDWEQAVRGAIDASFAVVLVASPASARSVYYGASSVSPVPAGCRSSPSGRTGSRGQIVRR